MDVDRGYFPRNAFIDRRFNPRPAAAVFTRLQSLFSRAGSFEHIGGENDAIEFTASGVPYRLVCAPCGDLASHLGGIASDALAWDLFSGAEASLGLLRGVLDGTPDAIQALLVRV